MLHRHTGFRKGVISERDYADLVLIDLDHRTEVNRENIIYKCGWSPLRGKSFRSRVTHTWVNGKLVFNRGKIDETVRGMRLYFEKIR